jgi:glycosyltransferase involved in cell wall biosynthesis
LRLKKKVLFLLPYPLQQAPSQRFRVEAYFGLLEQNNIDFDTDCFLNDEAWQVLYKKGSVVKKAWAVCAGFLKRASRVLLKAGGYDYIFIHREASPLGPPIFEWFLAKVMRKKIIYDFDDAIWIPNTSNENKLVNWVKAFWKIKHICRWAYKVAGGNEYLCRYAARYNKNIVLLPTCVDTERRHNQLKDQQTEKLVIGWTGSHSTMKYLDALVPVLEEMAAEAPGKANVEIVIISNKAPQFSLDKLRFIPWSEATEIEDLLRFNIGIMPLEDDTWSEGKCGFKLIQYLALGIPAVASPVGVNKQIVEQGINGYLCETEEEWHQSLQKLVQDSSLRAGMGAKGRAKMVTEFSIQANAARFLGLFS